MTIAEMHKDPNPIAKYFRMVNFLHSNKRDAWDRETTRSPV